MKLPTLRRPQDAHGTGLSGVVRLDRRTKDLTKRLKPGDIAVIDHIDIDRVSAEALVACGVAAVVNAAQSISGRYPNLGPEILTDAGIPLIDHVGEEVFTHLKEGQRILLENGVLSTKGNDVAEGEVLDAARVSALMSDARAGMSTQLESFTANTVEYLRRERDLLLDGAGMPDIETKIENRHVLIVVRGYDYKQDLVALRHYIREYKPVLIGVDDGADALVEAGHEPDLIVGDMDSVSDKTLRGGAEVVVHAYRDGRSIGMERLEKLGVTGIPFRATGTSEDVAMLLADDKGATIIVAVGSHATLLEFLDKGRSGMASTFLTRLRVGPKLIDAKGVNQLYRTRIRAWQLLFLLVAGLIALGVAVAVTPAGREWLSVFEAPWDDFTYWLQGLFS